MFYQQQLVAFLLHHLQQLLKTPAGIESVSLSLTFSLSTGLVKKFLKTTRNKKKKHNKIVMFRSKLNCIESKLSEILMNNEISHENLMTVINDEGNYRELKEIIRMIKGQEDKKNRN